MNDTETDRIVCWNLEPFIPVREDVLGEVIFVRRWQELMGGTKQENDVYFLENEPKSFPIIGVFGYQGYPDDRSVRLATSLVRWLGTNIGQLFLENCQKITDAFDKAGLDEGRAYLAGWALHTDPSDEYFMREHIVGVNELTAHDMKAIERVILWLGGEAGQEFVRGCQQELRRARVLVPQLSFSRAMPSQS